MPHLKLVFALYLASFAFAAMSQTTPPPKLVFEKTYLHTDRDLYAAGDTLWFKAYLTDAQSGKPAFSSGLLHVEFISPEAKILITEHIRMESGLGHGDFALPDTLAAGIYRLRAYTSWMRNFGNNFVFEKNIEVLSPGNNKVTASVAAATVSKAGAAPNAAVSNRVSTAHTIKFYPEGGSLVESVGSVVGVKTESGQPSSGAVISSAGDTVAHFFCDISGLGEFLLLPVKGQTYRAVLDQPKAAVKSTLPVPTFPLPSALTSGLAIQVRQTDSLLRVVVGANTPGGGVSLVMKHAGQTLLSQQLTLQDNQLAVRIPTIGLPEGVSVLTLYDGQNKPQCERLVYIHQPGRVNQLALKTNKPGYQSKEKATLQIAGAEAANLSVAVVDAGLMPQDGDDITSYLMLSSEVKGRIENPRRYFDTTNHDRFKQLDLLLLTQGWRDFVWRRLADTAIRISYPAEQGLDISGRLRDEVNNKLMPGVNITLYADAARGNTIYPSLTDANGRFDFSGISFYGKQNIRLAAVNDKGEKRGSFLIDTIRPAMVSYVIPPLQSKQDSVAETELQKQNIIIKNAGLRPNVALKEVKIKSTRQSTILRNGGIMSSWGAPESFDIKPEDEKFKTLEWFLLQNTKGAQKAVNDPNTMNIPGVAPRPLTGVVYMGQDTAKHGGMSMGGSSGDRINLKSKPLAPLLFVNGRELDMEHDYEQAESYREIYFSLPITKFKKVELRHVAGSLHGLGISAQASTLIVDRFLLYLTLADNALITNPGSLSADVDGFYQARTFYEPPAADKGSLADYRSTIYWRPDIKTEASGKAEVTFDTGKLTGKAGIVVQGLTNSGIPVAATTFYLVK